MLSTLGASHRQGDVDEAKNEWNNFLKKFFFSILIFFFVCLFLFVYLFC